LCLFPTPCPSLERSLSCLRRHADGGRAGLASRSVSTLRQVVGCNSLSWVCLHKLLDRRQLLLSRHPPLPPAGRSCAQETPECVVPAGGPTPVSSANRVVWWPLRGARGDGAHRPVVVPGNVPAARRCVLSRCAKREDTPKPRAAQSPQTTPSQLRPPWASRRWLSMRFIFKSGRLIQPRKSLGTLRRKKAKKAMAAGEYNKHRPI
jgi:hypothetical protein